VVWLGCGKQDSLFPRSQKLADLFGAHQVKHTFRAINGFHTYALEAVPPRARTRSTRAPRRGVPATAGLALRPKGAMAANGSFQCQPAIVPGLLSYMALLRGGN